MDPERDVCQANGRGGRKPPSFFYASRILVLSLLRIASWSSKTFLNCGVFDVFWPRFADAIDWSRAFFRRSVSPSVNTIGLAITVSFERAGK